MHEESGSLPPEPNCMPDQLSDAAASSSHERVTGWRLSKGRGPQLDFAFGNFLTRTGVAKERSQVQAISFASAKATAAATPPITTVCAALRNAFAPVNRPLIKPNTPRAINVTTAEQISPRYAFDRTI